MNKIFKLIFIFLVTFAFVSLVVFSQSRETGSIEGKVTDDEGQPLPGVTITLSSPSLMGTRAAVTDDEGRYRFVALMPGTYAVEASLEGFITVKKENIRLHLGTTLTVDITLKIAKIAEEVIVTGEAPLIDVKGSTTGKVNLPIEFLQNIPSARSMLGVLNLAPGTSNFSGFGGGEYSSNAYQLDGVDTSEVRWGGNWIPPDYNSTQEIQIVAMGAPAEYSHFTGVLINSVSKLGGNRFSGMAEFLYQGKTWSGDNFDPDDPKFSLIQKASAQRYVDASFNLGGPIIKDKLWFFTGFSYTKSDTYIGEWDETYAEPHPLGFLKLTFQPNPNDRFQTFIQLANRKRLRLRLSAVTSPEATADLRHPELAVNVLATHIFSPNTFMEVKIAGYRRPQLAEPRNGPDVPYRWDASTGMESGNYPYIFKYKMYRIQGNVSLSHHAENFVVGSHSFKFGAEFTRGWGSFFLRNTADAYYLDNYPGLGGLGLAVSLGWDLRPTGWTTSMFAQDTWEVIENLTINPGLRYEIYRGHLENLGETVYKSSGFAPRLGFTWDVFGDHKTAFKAHYGRYHEKFMLGYFEQMDSGYEDTVVYLVLPGDQLIELVRVPRSTQIEEMYDIDPNIKHPCMDEITAGIERELIPDLSFGVTFIYRKWKNFVDQVNTGGIWEPVQVVGPDGKTYTVYNQLNPGEDKYYITNPEEGKDYGQAYPDIIAVPQYRKYTGIEFVLNKRFSKNWQLLASYVYSQAKGTLSNGYRSSYGQAALYHNPNNQINAEGNLWIDPTHLLKIQGTVILPLDFNLSGYFIYRSGYTWTRSLLVALDQGGTSISVEPRGSQRLPARTELDLRLEKTFALKETMKVGFMFDVFNVFNQGVETDVVSGIHQTTYGKATSIPLPRSFRAGIRIFF